MMSSERIMHLQMIEAVIERMAANSLRMKEWFVTVASALIGFAVTTSNADLALVATAPLFVFWCLDACYLHQERKYRDLYQLIVQDDASVVPFSMNVHIDSIKRNYLSSLLMSWSTFGFYGVILAVGILGYAIRDQLFICNHCDQFNRIKVENLVVERISIESSAQNGVDNKAETGSISQNSNCVMTIHQCAK